MNFSHYPSLIIAKIASAIFVRASELFVFVLFSISLFFIHPAFAASLTSSTAIPLTLADKTSALITLSQNQIVAKLSNGKILVLMNGVNRIPEYARDIWIEDFNFDGFNDIAITTSIDAYSSDQNYTVYSWENGLKQFIPMNFRASLSNIEVLPRKQQIRSSYQSGDFWTEDSYRFNNKVPYLYSKSALILNNVWHTTIYNPQGHQIRSLVSSDGRTDSPPQPVLLTVNSTSAPLYSHPLPSSILAKQLRKGDKVTILDFKRGMGHLNWVNIRSKQLHGWILLSNLLRG